MRRLVDRLLEHPFVYQVWQAPFVEQKFAPVRRQLKNRVVRRVLDVGCGPGTNAPRFASADYVGIDINERYLEVGRLRYTGQFICADLETSDLSSLGYFDTVLVNSFLHHLPDPAVHRILHQVAGRLESDGHVHILELVRPARPSLGSVMARLDRGRYARSLDHWREIFATHFNPIRFEPYTYAARLWEMVYFQGEQRCDSR